MIKRLVRSVTRPIRGAFRLVRKGLAWALGIPKPQGPEGLELSREGSDQHLPVVYGERLIGGVTVHKWVTSTISGLSGITSENRENAYLHMIVAFCHGPVDAIGQLYFNGEPETDAQYSDKYTAIRRTGTDAQDAIPQAVTNIANWTNDMRGRNVAYAYIVFYQDKDQTVWRGEPEIQAIIRGRLTYDPRSDTTTYNQNPALAALDYLTNPIYGRGLSLSDIDQAAFSAAADFCEEPTTSTVERTIAIPNPNRNLPPSFSTSTVEVSTPRYGIAAVLDTEAEIFNNYRELLQVFRAFPRRPNGLVSLGIEDVAPSTVPEFDESELEGGIVYRTGGQRERYNRFIIRYPNRLDRYERDEFVYPQPDNPLFDDWLAEDNGKELIGQLELNTIAETSYAAQSAEIAAKASRLSGVLVVNLPARARILEPGDIIAINSDLYGWTAKQFRIRTISENQSGTFEVELREHEDAVYPWSGASWSEQIGGSWLGNPTQPDAPTGLQITADPTFATAGRLTWTAVPSSFVRQYEVVIVQGGVTIQDDITRGTSYDIPLLDVGSYSIEVYAVTTLGYRSQAASIAFELATPLPPSDITLTPYNFEIEAAAVLAGIGLGTTFDYDIKETGDAGGYSPSAIARGVSVTFAGRKTDTDYTVYARTVNALGVSSWISRTVTTTKDASSIIDLIGEDFADTIFEPVVEELTERVGRANQRVADVRVNIVEEIRSRLGIAKERIERKTGIERLEVVIDEESFKLAALSQEVTAVVGSTAAISGLLQAAGLDEDGNTFATVALDARLETAEGNITAQAGLILDVEQTADDNKSALAGLRTAVAGSDSQSQAELILESTVDKADEAFSRAFLGVTTTVGGVSTINGIVVDGATNSLEFRADTIRWTDTGGTVQLYWDAPRGKVVFAGDMVAGTFQTALTGFRAEMSGSGSFPFWYGTGTKTLANARFAVDGSGNVTMRNATVQGSLVTDAGTGDRVEITPTGTYRIWIGSGTKDDANGDFWIKPGGVGFIKADFLVGQILEQKAASGQKSASVTHNSAGKPVTINANGALGLSWPGDVESEIFVLTVTIKRGSTTLRTFDFVGNARWRSSNNTTIISCQGALSFIDTITSTGNRTYTAEISVTPDFGFNSANFSTDISTLENKIG